MKIELITMIIIYLTCLVGTACPWTCTIYIKQRNILLYEENNEDVYQLHVLGAMHLPLFKHGDEQIGTVHVVPFLLRKQRE